MPADKDLAAPPCTTTGRGYSTWPTNEEGRNMIQVLQAATALATGGLHADITEDDLGISPNWDFPVIGWLRETVGGFWAMAFIIMFALFVLGALMVIGGRVGGSNRAGQFGLGGLLAGAIGMIFIGGAAGISVWLANQDVLSRGSGDAPAQVQVVAHPDNALADTWLGL